MSRLLVMPRRDDPSRASVGVNPTRFQGARLLLVTGTAGSGKKIVGSLLVDERAFVHIDLDNALANRRFLGHGIEGLRTELEANLEPGQDTVITWTPARNEALPFVRLMQSYGFDWVWLDGDRGAAFHGFFSGRNGDAARFVDPFADDGTFRPLHAVIGDVLEPGPVAQPLPARKRMPRELVAFARRGLHAPARSARAGRSRPARRHVRTGFAGGLAFVTAALAAAAYMLVGGVGGKEPLSGALGLKAAQAYPGVLPAQGVLVSGESLAGVRLGDTAATVRKRWGHNFAICEGCKPTTWFYVYPKGDPVGAGVTFRDGRVTAVFTLGMKPGWRSDDGLKVGGWLPANQLQDGDNWKLCAGYSAKELESSAHSVTSIFTNGPIIYGFSLARPSEPVCR